MRIKAGILEFGTIPLSISLAAILIAGVTIFGMSGAAAQPAHPDLSGSWKKRGRFAQGEDTPPPLTPAGQRIYERNKAGVAASNPDIDIVLKCLPPGFPRIAYSVNPFYFFQAPTAASIVGESGRQLILLDRPHRDIWPTFYGDSIGHWEGDTLVVDVTNVRDATFFNAAGLPHSDTLHVIEHFKLIDGGKTLENDMTIMDPKIFTRDWAVKVLYDRSDDNPPIENICESPRLHP